METICLLTVSWRKEYFCCVHLVGIFWYSLIFIFFNSGILISVQKLYKEEKKNIIGKYQKRNKKPCLSLMNRFNFGRRATFRCAEFYKKKEKTCSLQLFRTPAALQNIFKNHFRTHFQTHFPR